MAAQSEAASVKGSPFSIRWWRAVLYSTSGGLASWSFLISAPIHGSTRCNSGRSRRNRGSSGAARKNSVNKLPILDDSNTIYKHELNPLGVLQWLFIRGFVDDTIGVEHCNIRVRSHANSSFFFEHRGALLQPLRRHQRHLP